MVVRRRQWLLPGLFAVLLSGVFGQSAAEARKKVVVLGVSGPGGGQVRTGLVSGLRQRARIVSPAVYAKTARKLKVSAHSAAGRAAVCGRLRCHAVVSGSVKRRGRRYQVTLTVYNGADGEAIGRRAAGVRARRQLARTGRALAGACMALIARGEAGVAPVAARPDRPAPPPPTPEPTPSELGPEAQDGQTAAAAPPVEDELFTTRKRRRDLKEDLRKDDEYDDDVEVSKRSSRRRGGYAGLFDLSAAIGLATRNYQLAGANPAENSTYEGGMYPEFTARLELYPLILALERGFARNIGLGFSYSRHLSISTKLPSVNQEIDTSSWEMLIDARVRWTWWDRTTSPTLVLFSGLGLRNFDLGQNVVLTSFDYRFVRAGLDATVPLGTQLLALYAGFDARIVLGVGQEAVDAYGVRDGGFGWAARAGVCGRQPLGSFGISYFLAFEYLTFASKFAGRSDARPDLNPIERADPTEGSDRFIRLWAGAGLAL